MLYNQNNLDIANITYKNDIKQVLTGVYFTNKKTVATNGYSLIEMSIPEDISIKDFPASPTGDLISEFEPFIVKAENLKDIKIPKVKKLPILNHVAIQKIDNEHVEFFTTNLEKIDVKSLRLIDEQYPGYMQMMPKTDPLAKIKINGKYLLEIIKILSKLSPSNTITMSLYGEDKAILIEAKGQGQEARALIMPARN